MPGESNVMTQLRVQCAVLGQTEIRTDGIRLTPEAERQFGMALFFCANAGREVSRDEVAALFWPDHDTEAARHCLRQALYRLRAVGVPVRSGAKTSKLEERLVDADYATVIAEGASSSVYLSLSELAVLPGYAPRFSAPYAEWVEGFRTTVAASLRRGLVRAIADSRARGRYGEVERLARHCLAMDPLNDEATLALAEAVALAGGKAEAVAMIDRYMAEVGSQPELRVPSDALRERIADRITFEQLSVGELPMIGRDADLERMVTAFQPLREPVVVTYVLWGQAGIGKTRIARECCRIARLQGAHVVSVGTQPSSRSHSLSTVGDFMPRLLAMPGALGCAPAALQRLKSLSGSDIDRAPEAVSETDNDARFATVRWATIDLIDAILAEGPLVLHIDDAHYADPASLLVLEDVAKSFASRPLFLLLSMRDPFAPNVAASFRGIIEAARVHRLDPLTETSATLLVAEHCAKSHDSIGAAARERILTLSSGNPFFLLELLKHRQDVSSHGNLPISVQSLLELRLAQLSAAANEMLQACAVLGTESTLERMEQLIDPSSFPALAALSELETAGMISAASGRIVCRHEILRDLVLRLTPLASLHLLHRRAAQAFSRELVSRPSVSQLWACLHHWRNAGAPGSGVRVAINLAKRLLAAGLAAEALAVLEETEPHAEVPQDRARVLLGIARSSRLLRDWRRIRDVSSRWYALKDDGFTHNSHDEFELLKFEATFTNVADLGPLPGTIRRCITSHRASAEHRLDAALMALIHADNDADSEAANEYYEAARGIRPSSRESSYKRLCIDLIYHTGYGDLAVADSHARRLVDLASSAGQPATRALLLRRAAYAYRRTGSLESATAAALESLEISQRLRISSLTVLALELLAVLAIESRDLGAAKSWLDESRAADKAQPGFYSGAAVLVIEARLAFEIGDPSLISTDVSSVLDMGSFLRLKRASQSWMASQTAISLLKGHVLRASDAIAELDGLHDSLKARGLQDFPVAVLARGLAAQNRHDKARNILHDYVTSHRRERAPYPNSLERVLSDLDVEIAGALRC